MRFSKFKSWVAGLCVLALVGCGGGGGGGTPVLGGGTGGTGSSTAATVEIVSSSPALGDGNSTVQITAFVKDAQNRALANTAVQWSFDAGYLVDTVSVTDADGKATATFGAIDRSKQTANVKLTAGSVSGTVAVALQTVRTVAVDSPARTLGVAINGSTAVVTATVTTNPGNVAISGASVSWSTDAGTLKDIVSVTNSQGIATAVFDPGAALTKTPARITVRSAGYEGVVDIPVSAVSKTIEMLADASTIGSGGDQVVIRAVVKNGLTNAALPNEPISWMSSSGTLTGQQGATNSSGAATATLSAGGDKRNRDITVTVTSGGATQTLTVPVVDTRINYSGTTSITLDSSLTTNLTFTLVDSKGISIPGQTVAFTSSLGNSVAATGPTNAAGQVTAAYRPTFAGTDTITARGAGAVKAIDIVVTGTDERLTFDMGAAGNASVAVGQTKTVTLRYLQAGLPLAGKTVNLAATVGTLSVPSVVTDSTGSATFNLRSDFAGTSTITGAVANSTLRATTQIGFVATVPYKLILQVTRSALPPNTDGATQQVTTVSAKVIDVNFNPVPNVTVNFSQEADPSQGVLQQASADTDAGGIATVLYQSGPASTASGAVVLKGAVAAFPAVVGRTNLTVNERALFIVLGTGNSISNYDEQTYQKSWTLYVTDANGVRVPNKLLTVKVIPQTFVKGFLVWSESSSLWVNGVPPLSCPNEDGPDNLGYSGGSTVWNTTTNLKPDNYNFNGFLDAGEDLNRDGLLTPGNVVLLASSVVTTDSNGFATISLRYSENYVPWITARLTVTGTVEGTESTTFREFALDGVAGDFSVKTVPPAGVRSPFGVDNTSCNNKN